MLSSNRPIARIPKRELKGIYLNGVNSYLNMNPEKGVERSGQVFARENVEIRIPKRGLKGMSGTVPEPVGIGNPEKGVERALSLAFTSCSSEESRKGS